MVYGIRWQRQVKLPDLPGVAGERYLNEYAYYMEKGKQTPLETQARCMSFELAEKIKERLETRGVKAEIVELMRHRYDIENAASELWHVHEEIQPQPVPSSLQGFVEAAKQAVINGNTPKRLQIALAEMETELANLYSVREQLKEKQQWLAQK